MNFKETFISCLLTMSIIVWIVIGVFTQEFKKNYFVKVVQLYGNLMNKINEVTLDLNSLCLFNFVKK